MYITIKGPWAEIFCIGPWPLLSHVGVVGRGKVGGRGVLELVLKLLLDISLLFLDSWSLGASASSLQCKCFK